MNRKELVRMARRNLEHAKAGTVDQAPGVHRVPASHYVDPGRWQREMDRIFRRLPLMLCKLLVSLVEEVKGLQSGCATRD